LNEVIFTIKFGHTGV